MSHCYHIDLVEVMRFGIPKALDDQSDNIEKHDRLFVSQSGHNQWLSWREYIDLRDSEAAAATVTLIDRLLKAARDAKDGGAFLTQQLPEIAADFSAQWSAVVQRDTEWQCIAEYGRRGKMPLPKSLLDEVLDRESAALQPPVKDSAPGLLAVPIILNQSTLLLMGSTNFVTDALTAAVVLGRVLGTCLELARRHHRATRRIDRLQETLQMATRLSATRDTGPLLDQIAEEATGLLDCDRASIFLWDREHHEVVACPALGIDGTTLRLPDDVGIVGRVIQTGNMIRVDDAYHDERFHNQVDQSSGYTTRNLLCGPVVEGAGRLIGAFEVINKNGAESCFTSEDEETLAELGRQVGVAVQNAREREELIRSRQQLTAQVTQGVEIIGDSAAMVALRATIERLATNDLPVLILGESGTGKEVVSQALHYHGSRANHPFVAVNCAALPETLLESELFGHEKGAFTDAHETRAGKFELAEGGTLFLDEIGDMSPGGQARLLRVLEQKVVNRVGGSQPIPLNVRVVAATNTDLLEAVRAKRFREDLYYRLSVVTLDLPPLRERSEDVLHLAEHFLGRFCADAGRKRLGLSPEAQRRLLAHDWPGNVRELRNLMERIAFLSPGEQIEMEDLAFILSPTRGSAREAAESTDLKEATCSFQQRYIRQAIQRAGHNMSEAARLLGLHRSNLYRKMRQLGMNDFNEDDMTV